MTRLTISETFVWLDDGMSTKRVGRPSKGARHVLVTRVPEDLHAVIAQESAARGLSQSEYTAIMLGRAHGREVELPNPVSDSHLLQEFDTLSA